MIPTIEERIALGKKFARKYFLDYAVVCAVVEQESNWNSSATRYEPAFRERYVVPLRLNDDAEEAARSTSWGLMQLMGQVARELGYVGDLKDLCDPEIGMDFGCKKLRKCFDASPDEMQALQHYNGGGNPGYAQQVRDRMPKYW